MTPLKLPTAAQLAAALQRAVGPTTHQPAMNRKARRAAAAIARKTRK